MEQIAYKLLKIRKNGTLGPLFINASSVTPMHVWMQSENHPTKGFAIRQGWHCTFTMNAPHIAKEPKNGCRRVWCKVLVKGTTTYNRPESQGGAWILADHMKIIEIIG